MSNRCGSDGLCAKEWKIYFPTGLCFTPQYINSSPVSDKDPPCRHRFNMMTISRYHYTCKANYDSIINRSWIWPLSCVLRLCKSCVILLCRVREVIMTVYFSYWLFRVCECFLSSVPEHRFLQWHYNNYIMNAMSSQTTGISIVYSVVISGADQWKHQAPRHWPLCGEFTGDRWIPRTKGQ